MTGRTLSLVVGAIAILILTVGVSAAFPAWQPSPPSLAAATVTEGITYQGRLNGSGGNPVDGSVTMRFVVYDHEVAGSAVWDSGDMNVTVQDGLFTVTLGVDHADFNGQALWLSIIVEGLTLSPRHELSPAPYALGLRPGADIVGDAIAAGDAILAGVAPATGAALQADANGGVGLLSASQNNIAVHGASNNSWGGYFTSDGGYGLRVESNGDDHYDHGAYISSDAGYAVYAQSAANQALRGEAGDITGISQPLGTVGVAGIGANRGVYGASNNGVGVYGTTDTNYAGYFYSDGYRGLYASSPPGYFAGYFTNRGGSGQPGLYVNGTLNVNGSITATGSKAGYVVDISLNAGPEALEAGDLVAVVGVDDPVVGAIPVMRVVKATADNAAAVVGVVDQRFVVEEENGERLARPAEALPQNAAGNAIQAEEYLSVVTLGAFMHIKVDAAYGPIQPGDLLTPSPNPGHAMRASDASPGTIVGKALESWDSGQGAIAVYVTMQ